MFEKIDRLADGMATSMSTSRRGFLGRLGKMAMGAAGAVGTVLLLSGNAQAHAGTCWYCEYKCPDGSGKVIGEDKKCKATYEGCNLVGETKYHCF
jgi:hypothetical protein